MLEKLRKNKTWIIILVVGCVLSLLTGLALSPTKTKTITEEKVVYKDRIVEKIVEKEKVVEDKKVDKDIKKNVKVTKTEIKKPDGTTIVSETTEDKTEDKTREVETKVVEKVVYQDKIVEKLVEKEVVKIVGTDRDWRVGLMLGTSVTNLSVSPEAPYLNPIIVGVGVERRIVGGLYAGLWAQTSSFKTLEAGIGLSFNF